MLRFALRGRPRPYFLRGWIPTVNPPTRRRLTELGFLDLPCNDIRDISAVSGLTSLDTLGLSANSIVDVSAIEGLVNLASLGLGGNSDLTDIQAILANTGIGAGDWVDLEQTAVSCADVKALRARGVIAVATGCQ